MTLKRNKIFTIFLSFLMVIGVYSSHTIVHAANELKNVITDIKIWDGTNQRYLQVKDNTYEMYENTTYRYDLTFDLNKYKDSISNGDYFKFTIPEQFKVKATTFTLTDDKTNVDIGNAVVKANEDDKGGEVRVTLQNLDEYLSKTGGSSFADIKGTIYVDITTTEVTTTTIITYEEDEVENVVSFSLKVKEKTTSDYSDIISKENFNKVGGRISEKSYQSTSLGKNGDYIHSWLLRINTRQAEYNTITINDSVSNEYAPMQFIPENFKIEYGYYDSNLQFTSEGVLTKDTDYTITYNSAFTVFEAKIINALSNRASNNKAAAYRVSYYTTSPADGNKVANSLEVLGDDEVLTTQVGRNETTMTVVRDAKLSGGGSISVDPSYRVILYKIDEETGDPLKGAVFTIETPTGEIITLDETDENGRTVSRTFTVDEINQGQFKVVEAEAPEGYEIEKTPIMLTVSESGVTRTITNKKEEKTSVTVTKKWDDKENQDGIRPKSITVNLKVGNDIKDTIILNSDNKWTYTFENLTKYNNDEEIQYTVEEELNNTSYKSKVTGNKEDGFIITNTYTPEKTSVKVTKKWDDNEDQDGKRPKSITVNLLADGVKVDSQEISPDNNGNWKYKFTNLDKYKDGKEIVYTVSEEQVKDYETPVIEGNQKDGYTITNKHILETTTVTGTKTWDDKDDQDGKRPNSITVNLLADGVKVDSKEVSPDNDGNWTYEFTDLPKYKDGKEITYTVSENEVKDYTTTYNGNDITNSYTPGKRSITVNKVWDDSNDKDKLRPTSIKVQLYANGKKVGNEVTLSEANNWRYTFTDLDVKANKKDIEYSVKEVSEVKGYTKVEGEVTNGNVTITNKHTPKTTTKVKTGDFTNISMLVMTLIISLFVLITVLRKRFN